MKERLTKCVRKFNLIAKQQLVFQEGLSTKDAIEKLVSSLYNSMDRSEPTAVSQGIRFSESFTIAECLGGCRNTWTSRNLFEGYPTNRTQVVKINE